MPIVLDDLHAADTPSVEFLLFLARSLPQPNRLVVASYRDTEVGEDRPQAGAVAQLRALPTSEVWTLDGGRG